MQLIFTIVHVLVCVVLILVVLLQAGKGASMGAVFGGSSQTIFGSTGATSFLGKMTTVVAIVFMLTSLVLSYTTIHKGSASLMGSGGKPAAGTTAPAPAAPAVPAAPQPVAPAGSGSAPAPAGTR